MDKMPIYLDKFIFAVFYRLDLLIALPERLRADARHSRELSSWIALELS